MVSYDLEPFLSAIKFLIFPLTLVKLVKGLSVVFVSYNLQNYPSVKVVEVYLFLFSNLGKSFQKI